MFLLKHLTAPLTHAQTVAVVVLETVITHRPGPGVVSPETRGVCGQFCLLSRCVIIIWLPLCRVDFNVVEEGRSGILSLVRNGVVLCAVEVGVLHMGDSTLKINVEHVKVICHLEGWSELRHSRRVKVVGVALVCCLGEHPELVLVELGRDQRGHHREHSLVQSEVSIWSRASY